jgi:hypothetical protein
LIQGWEECPGWSAIATPRRQGRGGAGHTGGGVGGAICRQGQIYGSSGRGTPNDEPAGGRFMKTWWCSGGAGVKK